MKLQLTQFFAQAQNSGQFIDVSMLECRSTICEVQAISLQPVMDSRWRTLMEALPQQAWFHTVNANFMLSNHESGSKFLMMIRRKPQ
jgi:N-acetylglutamate synthase-like GNAT family acetyltransferase